MPNGMDSLLQVSIYLTISNNSGRWTVVSKCVMIISYPHLLSIIDLLFPWFMWIMGVSMALSFVSMLKTRSSSSSTSKATSATAVERSRLLNNNDPADSGVYSGSHRLSYTGSSEHHTHSLVSSTSNPLPEYKPNDVATAHHSQSGLSQGFNSSIGASSSSSHTITPTSQPSAALASYTVLDISIDVWMKVFRRALLLFLIGMFLANGYKYQTWRVPGVLQYFAVSYFITSITVLSVHLMTKRRLEHLTVTCYTEAVDEKTELDEGVVVGDDVDHNGNNSRNWLFNQPETEDYSLSLIHI